VWILEHNIADGGYGKEIEDKLNKTGISKISSHVFKWENIIFPASKACQKICSIEISKP
jgi:hypothetical protein